MRKSPIAAVLAAALALAGCASVPSPPAGADVTVSVIAFNDFHGNLEPPHLAIEAPADGGTVRVPAGGAAYLAGAIKSLRAANPNSVVVSAGDMVGASPLVSALFLDEPSITTMNLIPVDFNAVGNHEFDRGRAELLRLQNGGCEKHATLQPCRLEPFAGARFPFLAANVITETGEPLFPAYGIRDFGPPDNPVRIAFIGMTLKGTPTVTTPGGIVGLDFRDEADTANALIPRLRAEGADAIVVLLHQGGETDVGYNDKSCAGFSGELLPILDRLDPAVDLVVSGHTHQAYICDYGRMNASRPFLVTSAGRFSTLVTNITLRFDARTHRLRSKSADNVIVQGEGFEAGGNRFPIVDRYPRFAADPAVAALVARYAAATKPLMERKVGRLSASATKDQAPSGEFSLGNLIADAQLAAARSATNGAQLALMNSGGVRTELMPATDGTITFGQLFASQPFGNTIIVKAFTGRQLRAILEQQFNSGRNTVEQPNMLLVSGNVRYGYDLSRPAGQRIQGLTVDGVPVGDDAVYRVAMNSFLASGGDNFTIFTEGRDQVNGPQDIDALEAYFAGRDVIDPPATDRIRNLTPP